MRLTTCIVSSDASPAYLDFFPLVRAAWRRLVGVRCILMLVAERIPDNLLALTDDILLCPAEDGVHPAFQAQCIRLLAPQLIGDTQGAVVISDVDMLPLRKSYFTGALAAANEAQFVVYRDDAIPREAGETAICYNAATPQTWADVFGEIGNVKAAREVVREWYGSVTYGGTHGGSGWATDQRLLHTYLDRFDKDRVLRRTDRELGFRRLDRPTIGTQLSWSQRELVARSDYADYHMKRPAGEFALLNERIADLAPADRRSSPLVPLLRLIDDHALDRRLGRLVSRLTGKT